MILWFPCWGIGLLPNPPPHLVEAGSTPTPPLGNRKGSRLSTPLSAEASSILIFPRGSVSGDQQGLSPILAQKQGDWMWENRVRTAPCCLASVGHVSDAELGCAEWWGWVLPSHSLLQSSGAHQSSHSSQRARARRSRAVKLFCSCCLVTKSNSFLTPGTVAHQASLSMDFPGKITAMGCQFLLQGLFPTQGPNLGLLHWHMDSLPLSHPGGPLKPF